MVGMKLITAQRLCVRLMAKFGVLGNGDKKWRWGGFNNKRANCGECYVWEGSRKIMLSKHYVVANPEENVRNTILHEIAHALDTEERGDSWHDAKWRKWCRFVGCREERINDKAIVKYKYNDKCCGSHFGRHRISSNCSYKCSSCDRELFVNAQKKNAAHKYKLNLEDLISVR
jgi:predicted SprT family Zn-dependent metalloprotease